MLWLSSRYVCWVDITGPVYKKQVAYGMNIAAASPIWFGPNYGVCTKSTSVNGKEAMALCTVFLFLSIVLFLPILCNVVVFTLDINDVECISPTPW